MHRNSVDDWWADGEAQPPRVTQFILRQMPGEALPVIEDGPFDPNDPDALDNVLVELLAEHPFDERPVYSILTIDEERQPDIDPLDDLSSLMAEAWEEDDDEDEEDEEDDDTPSPDEAARPGGSKDD